MLSDMVLAIDIGGTKIAAGLVDPNGRIHQYKETPTRAAEGGEAVMQRATDLAHCYLTDKHDTTPPFSCIGVSSAGQINFRTGQVIWATENLPGWTGMPIKENLESALDLPITVDNDVNCMAMGEMVFGAARGYRHILCLMIGTGIGGGLILDGQLYRGWRGSAGELGHFIIDEHGPICPCGARGCLEVFTCGPAIERDYAARILQHQEKGGLSTLPQIAQLAHNGDADAREAIRTAGYHLGIGLVGMVNLLNPQIVVVGGGVVRIGALFLDEARSVVKDLALGPMRETEIAAAQLEGAFSSLVGAAVLARVRQKE
jgi:glucokinase